MRASLPLLTVLLGSAIAGCIIPGQYKIYRVAAKQVSQSPGCPVTGDPGDSSTFKNGMTFAIFAADTETYYLDLDMMSVEGKRDGSKYTFEGDEIDVTDGGTQTTTTFHNLTVKAEISTKKISGSWVEETSTSCTGMGCPQPFSCTIELDFEGSEVKDAELQHPV